MLAAQSRIMQRRAAAPRAPINHHVEPLPRVVAHYLPPSHSVAASELQLLGQYSQLVPDVPPVPGTDAAAATVSHGVLSNIANSESLGMKPYQQAITGAVNAPVTPDEKLEMALVNVGVLYSQNVSGRVCTDVDGRLAHDTDAMVAKVKKLLALYHAQRVDKSKLIFRLPGTWEGIQAAQALEACGIATQVYLIFSLIQAVAAAQAGVSVVQPNVGRIRDVFLKFPNALRDTRGPRQDAGLLPGIADPGVALVQQIFCYVKKYHHDKTRVMASGIRNKEDALALSGCDYLILPKRVLADLDATPTVAGYNDGLQMSVEGSEGEAALSARRALQSKVEEMERVNRTMFEAGLGFAAAALLQDGLQASAADADRALPMFEKGTTAHSAT